MWSPSESKCWIHRFDCECAAARAHKKYDKSHTVAVISRTNRQNIREKKRSSTFRIRSDRSLPSRVGCGTHVCACNDDRDDDRLRFYSFMPASGLRATVRENEKERPHQENQCSFLCCLRGWHMPFRRWTEMTAIAGSNKNTNGKQVFVTVRCVYSAWSSSLASMSFIRYWHVSAFVSVSLTLAQRDTQSSHARPAPTENEFNKNFARQQIFRFFFLSRGSRSLCKRRTYEYHFVHTHNFRFSFSVNIFAITISSYFCVWHTHHSARYKFNGIAALNCEITAVLSTSAFERWSGVVLTEFLLAHIALTARHAKWNPFAPAAGC